MTASSYRERARFALKNNWLTALCVTLVASLLGAGGSSGSGSSRSGLDRAGNINFNADLESLRIFYAVIAVIGTILLVYLLISFVLGGVIDAGQKQYYIDLVRGEKQAEFGTLFSKFDIFGKAFLVNLLKSIIIIIGTFLLVVPGIILSFSLSMTSYILADNPELTVTECLSRSREMMKGHKFRLFCLHFSFIGWMLLGAFTFGIGFLWLNPYINTAETAFYLDISGTDSVIETDPQRANG